MWKELLKNISEEAEFNEPATQYQVEEIQAKFNLELPNELINFLKETNGIDVAGLRIWSAKEIIEENVDRRTDEIFKDMYMPFECLLFFGDAGNGDLFGFSIVNGDIQSNNIFVWNHEDDSRTWIAPYFEEFLVWWSEGTISI